MKNTLRIVSLEGVDAKVVVTLADEAGANFVLPLSVFDSSTLVSGLYAAQGEALKQAPKDDPEVMLQIYGLQFGESGDLILMRIKVAEGLYQDYCAEKDSPLGLMMAAFSASEASRLGQSPRPFGGGGSSH